MRLPVHRRPLVLTAAAGALAIGSPTLAQTADSYEYAQPAPDGAVIYRSREVVQGAPGPQSGYAGPVETSMPPAPPLPPAPPMPPMPPVASHHAVPPPPPYGQVGYGDAVYPAPYPAQHYGYAMPAGFDRGRWLDECHERIRGVDRRDRGGVIGGLLGAITGGVVGNRAWGSERTAGTLLGAGVGGLAGLAIGSAIGAASERRHEDECAFYLDRYMASYPGPQAYPGYGYPGYSYAGYGYPGYGYGGYALVPVLVAVPQRQVVRETVTEEWVDEPVRSRSIAPRRHRSSPAPRVKYTKGN